MSGQGSWRKFFAAAVISAVSAPAFASEREHDDANARRIARYQWYNDSYGKADFHKRQGGPWSATFQRHMNDAAAKERAKYQSTLPGTASTIQAVSDPIAPAAATGTTWVNIGPSKANYLQNGSYTLNKTDSGRVNSVIVDPNNNAVIYQAFSGGGVWKSTDGGVTWTPITETLGSLSVGTLEMDPTNSQTLYLGLGDPFDGTGVGFVKSVDGGATWFNPVYLGSSTIIPDIEVVRSNPNIVLVATNAGLFRSVDAGASFSQVALSTGYASAPYVWSLAWAGGSRYVLTLEGNPAATSGSTDGQIFVSADDGATWTKASGISTAAGVDRMTVVSAPSNRAILYTTASNPSGDLTEIFKSVNAGASWTALGAAGKRYANANTEARTVGQLYNTQGWYNQATVISPTDPNTVYFGGALHLARTTDGGSTFRQVSNWLAQFSLPYVHADFHAGTWAGGKIFIGTDGGLFVSSDNGATWSDSMNVGISSHLIYQVGSSPAAPDAVIAGLQDNGTRVRVSNGTIYNQELGGDGFGCDINRSNGKTMLGTLYYTRIYKSTDGGLNFSSASTGITESNTSNAPFITKLAAWEGDATGNTVFTYVNAKVYKSTNYATSWSALGTSGLPASGLVIRGIGVAKSNANVIGLAANSGRVFLTNNGGASWTQAATPPNQGLSMNDVAFDPTNPNTVYLTSVAPDGTKSHFWKSTNFGASWVAAEAGLPAGVPVNAVVVDPQTSTTLYAATHLGVYRSTDAGATWARFGTGMPLVEVTDLYISPDSTLVRASTFGRSVWELRP